MASGALGTGGFRLLLMRHAKSAWRDPSWTDHERPLKKRGRRDAVRVADALSAMGWTPELILSSDARRALETGTRMCRRWPRAALREMSSLYAAGIPAVRSALRELSSETRNVLLLGHNPGWEEVLLWLTGRSETLTTANVACLQTEDSSWASSVAAPGRFRVEALIRPRLLAPPPLSGLSAPAL